MHSIDAGGCKFDIVCCIVWCCFVLCVMYFLTSFMSACCTAEFVDLRNDMYVCMYVCNSSQKAGPVSFKFHLMTETEAMVTNIQSYRFTG
jgi:Na+/H+-dicarboxylate symporter